MHLSTKSSDYLCTQSQGCTWLRGPNYQNIRSLFTFAESNTTKGFKSSPGWDSTRLEVFKGVGTCKLMALSQISQEQCNVRFKCPAQEEIMSTAKA